MSAHITQGSQPNVLHAEGNSRDLARLVQDGEHTEDFTVFMGGLGIASVKRDGQHDGRRAYVFDLADGFMTRSVGRMIIQDRVDFREDQPEWDLVFASDEGATAYLAATKKPKQDHDVISVQLDMSFDEPDPRRVLAEWSAAYGVSFHIDQEFGPAGGNPVVAVSGLRKMVVKWMEAEYVTEGTESVEFYLGESES